MSEGFGNPLVNLLLDNGEETAPSVSGELTRQRFTGDRSVRQTESRWVPGSGPYDAGRWVEVESIDAGPADVGQ